MSHLVPIAPGVVFSSDVLASSWGSEYRGGAPTEHADLGVRQARQSMATADASVGSSQDVALAQMSLL